MSESGNSIMWIIIALLMVVTFFGWGFMAGSYVGAHDGKLRDLIEMSEQEMEELAAEMSAEEREELLEGVINSATAPRSRGIGMFFLNAMSQLPNFLTIIGWHFSNRIWLPLTIIAFELLVLFTGYKMKVIEKEMAKPYHRRR